MNKLDMLNELNNVEDKLRTIRYTLRAIKRKLGEEIKKQEAQ